MRSHPFRACTSTRRAVRLVAQTNEQERTVAEQHSGKNVHDVSDRAVLEAHLAASHSRD